MTTLPLRWLRYRKAAIVGLVCLICLGALGMPMPAMMELVEQNPPATGWVAGFFALAAITLACSLDDLGVAAKGAPPELQ